MPSPPALHFPVRRPLAQLVEQETLNPKVEVRILHGPSVCGVARPEAHPAAAPRGGQRPPPPVTAAKPRPRRGTSRRPSPLGLAGELTRSECAKTRTSGRGAAREVERFHEEHRVALLRFHVKPCGCSLMGRWRCGLLLVAAKRAQLALLGEYALHSTPFGPNGRVCSSSRSRVQKKPMRSSAARSSQRNARRKCRSSPAS